MANECELRTPSARRKAKRAGEGARSRLASASQLRSRALSARARAMTKAAETTRVCRMKQRIRNETMLADARTEACELAQNIGRMHTDCSALCSTVLRNVRRAPTQRELRTDCRDERTRKAASGKLHAARCS